MSEDKTSLGAEEHISIAIAYVFGWLSGIVILLVEKVNATLRYHAAQSIIVFGSYTLLTVILPVLLFMSMPILLVSLLNLAA